MDGHAVLARLFLIPLCVLVTCALASPAVGQDIVDPQDAQLWLQWNGQLPIARGWGVVLEGQPRWNQNLSHLDQVTLRGGVQKRVTPALQLSAAYSFVPRNTEPGMLYEHQLYEQAVVTLPRLGRWMPQVRVRQDQRYLAQWGDAAHRTREQIRVTRPLPNTSRWLFVAHQELFLNLDDTERGPAPGIDQHRLFTGVQHPLTRDLAIETGYMWQELFRLGARPARHNHIAVVQFQFRPKGAGSRLSGSPPPMPTSPALGD